MKAKADTAFSGVRKVGKRALAKAARELRAFTSPSQQVNTGLTACSTAPIVACATASGST